VAAPCACGFQELQGRVSGPRVRRAGGRLPERGDEIEFAGFHFKVLRADPRRVQLLRVMRTADARAAARGG
jgi:Mg2+/Co2+ transporter CorC